MRKSPVDAIKRVWDYIEGRILLPYQVEWIKDTSRFKICLKARQIGISDSIGLEGALDVLGGEPVFYISRTEKQSIYLLEKFYKWMEFFHAGGVGIDYTEKSRTECKINGVDVKSLTSNAVAGEGFSGNVYLDEFGLHENDEQIYRSLVPTITWGYKIRVVSRPFGQSNKFYELWNDVARYPDYSRHKYDINRALGDGLPVDIGELRRNLDDESFREMYLCEFVDESTSYFPYVLLRSAIGECSGGSGDHFLGMDIGRKRDATVIYVVRKLGDRFQTVEIRRLRGTKFADQRASLKAIMEKYKIVSGRVDATGMGMQLAEEIHNEFPQIRPLVFTQYVKVRMVTTLKRLFEEHLITIPDDQELVAACHSIKKTVTANNNVIFDAARNTDGHADDFWALALAVDGRTPIIVTQY